MEVRRLQRNGESFYVNLPKRDLLDVLGEEPGEIEGQNVAIERDGDGFNVKPL